MQEQETEKKEYQAGTTGTVADPAPKSVEREQVGEVYSLEIISQIQKSRFISFHPSAEAAVLELSQHGGRPWKNRANTVTKMGQIIFDAMQGDGLALIGRFQVVDVRPTIAIVSAGALDSRGKIVLA